MFNMKKLSTGEPSTLGTYRSIALRLTKDEKSEVVNYFDQLIEETENGGEEVVTENETRMMIKISRMIHLK